MAGIISSTIPAMTSAMRILAYKPGAPTITWNVTEDSANARLHPHCKDFPDQDWRQFVFRSEGAVNTDLPHGGTATQDMGKGECGSIVLVMTLYESLAPRDPARHSIKIIPPINEPGVTVDMVLKGISKLLQDVYEEGKGLWGEVLDWTTFVTDQLDRNVSFAGLVATDLPYVYDVIVVQPPVAFIHAKYPCVRGSNSGRQRATD